MNHNQPDLQDSSPAIFVTGASGFIGYRLVSGLLNQGHNVRVLVRPEKCPDSRMPTGCEQVSAHITDVEKLTDIVAESSAVVYCAGSVRGRKPTDFESANIRGVHAMLGALERVDNAPPLLLLSSLAASRPQLSYYAHSKFEGEQLLRSRPSISWTIIRPPAVYGPGDKEMLPLLKMARRGLLVQTGPRGQRLSLLHVDDLVNAISCWIAVKQRCLHKTYSIDDGKVGGYSWEAIAEAVGSGNYRILKLPRFLLNTAARVNLLMSFLFGYLPMLTPGKVRELTEPAWLSDNHDFTSTTAWSPSLDLRAGSQQLFKNTSDT